MSLLRQHSLQEERAVLVGRQPINWPSLAFMFWSSAAMRNAAIRQLPKYAGQDLKRILSLPIFEMPRVRVKWRGERSNWETATSIFWSTMRGFFRSGRRMR